MSSKNTADIDELIREIEHYRVNLNDPCLGSGFWDEAVKDFIQRHSGKLVNLLEELGKSRGKVLINLPADHLHHITVEGRSDTGPAEALSAALNKAILYFSYQHEIILILQKILKLAEGGYSVTIELRVLPLSPKGDMADRKQDDDLKHIHDHDYGRKHKGPLVKYPVFNHFAGSEDDGQADLPDYILVNVGDPTMMNFMIGEKFFDVGHLSWPPTPTGIPPPKQMMVRIRRPRMELVA